MKYFGALVVDPSPDDAPATLSSAGIGILLVTKWQS
jgi:hypothetical protein